MVKPQWLSQNSISERMIFLKKEQNAEVIYFFWKAPDSKNYLGCASHMISHNNPDLLL